MKTRNRLFAILLALAMVVTYMPGLAYATEAQPDSGQPAAGAETGGDMNDNAAAENVAGEGGGEETSLPGEKGEEVEEKETKTGETAVSGEEVQGESGNEEETALRGGGTDTDGTDGGDGSEEEGEGTREAVTVTLSGVRTELMVNEKITYEASAEGAFDKLFVFFDYDEERSVYDQWARETDGSSLSSRDDFNSYGQEGEYRLVAAACVYDEEKGEMVIVASQEQTVTVTSNGKVGDFDITGVEGGDNLKLTLTRGDSMTVKFSESVNADNYWIEVYEGTAGGGHVMWLGGPVSEDGGGLRISVNTIELAAGKYYCYVGANGAGFENNFTESRVVLTVNERDVEPGGMFLSVSNDGSDPERPLQTFEDFEFAAYCPGATRIEIFKDYDENRGDRRDRNDTDAYTDRESYGNAGRHRFVAKAYRWNDQEGKEDEIAFAEKYITVTAPNGSFDISMPDLPAYITEGTDLDFTAVKPAGADGVGVESWFDLDDYDGDNRLLDGETSEDEYDAHIGGDKLLDGMRVVIKIKAWGKGYDYSEKEVRIPVFVDAEETGEAVLEVLKEVPDEGLPIHDNFDILVRPTGDRKFARIRLFDGRDLRGEEDADDDGSYRRGVNIDEPGTVSIFARVQFEGADEWFVTETVQVKAYSRGRMGSFDILKVNGKQKGQSGFEDITVTRGDTVSIECSEAEAEDEKRADHYWVDAHIRRENDGDEWWDWYEHFADSGSTGLSLNTIGFEPGTYRISVGANSGGYEDSHSDSVFILNVEDLNVEPGHMYFTVSKDGSDAGDPLLTGEDVTFSAFCPGADRIEVFFSRDDDPGWRDDDWREGWSGEFSYGNAGIHKLVAVAYDFDNGDPDEDFVVASEEISMTVSAPNGWPQIVIPEGIPQFIREGEQSISFSFEKPVDGSGEKLDGGLLVDSWFDRDDYEGDNALFFEETGEDCLDVTIDTSDLKEGDRVRIVFESWGLGYERGREEITIPVLGESTDKVSLTAGSSEVPVNKSFELTVDAGDSIIERLEFYDGRDWCGDRQPEEESSTYQDWMSMDQAGSWAVFAKVLLRENIGAGDDGEDIWLTTDPVIITATRNGFAGSFALTKVNGEAVGQNDHEITIHPEDLISVEYEESENADHYWIDAEWYDQEDENNPWRWYGHYGDTGALVTGLGAAEFEPGVYRLCVKASGEGYESVTADQYIIMKVEESTLPDDGLSLKVSGTSLLTSENFTISAYAPSAARIGLVCLNEDGDPEWEDMRDGKAYSSTEAFLFPGNYVLTATAYGEEDDEVIGTPVTVNIEVTANKGYLTIIYPELPESICAENGLSFSYEKPENADGCRLAVCYKDKDDPDDMEKWDNIFWQPFSDGALDVRIPADKLRAGEKIYVRFGAWGLGYEYTEAEEIAIELKEHSLVAHEAKAAGCTEDGNSAYWSCSICGKAFADQNAETPIEDGSWVISATGHRKPLEHQAADPVNCTVEHWKCSECGKIFSDENGENEITSIEDTALKTAKASALAELDKIDPNNYSGTERTNVEKAIAAAKEQIRTAASVDAVNTAKNNAAKTVSAQKTNAQKQEEARKAAAPKEKVDLPAVKIAAPKAGKKRVTVKWKKINKKTQKKMQGIEIQVAEDKGFTKIVKSTTASKKKTSKVVKGLKPKTTYWVRIRAYRNAADGKHVSAWKSKKFKIKK